MKPENNSRNRLDNSKNRLLDSLLSNNFLGTPPKTQATKAKLDKSDHTKLKSLCTARKQETK